MKAIARSRAAMKKFKYMGNIYPLGRDTIHISTAMLLATFAPSRQRYRGPAASLILGYPKDKLILLMVQGPFIHYS